MSNLPLTKPSNLSSDKQHRQYIYQELERLSHDSHQLQRGFVMLVDEIMTMKQEFAKFLMDMSTAISKLKTRQKQNLEV